MTTDGPVNVANALRSRAVESPGGLAVAVASGTGYASLSFAQLDALSDRACHVLAELGVRRGTRVAMFVPPSPELFGLVFGLLRMEAVPVLVDPGLGLRRLGLCLEEAEAEVFAGVPKAHVARRLFGWGRGTVKRHLDVAPGGPLGRLLGAGPVFESRRSYPRSAPWPDPSTDADREAAVLFTSGSTGPPKGALYTHGMFAAQVAALRDTFGIEPGERDLATFPLFALFGPALGMAAVVPDMDTSRPASADPEKLLRAMREQRCTNFFASPALVDKLSRHCLATGQRLDGLRRAISAGAPLQIPVIERFAGLLPEGAQLHTPYGATECLPVASVASREILERRRATTEAGGGVCVGLPVGDVRIEIVAIEDGPIEHVRDARVLANGEIGEIVVTGSVASPAYVSRPEANALHKMADESVPRGFWHRTGDVGYLDDEDVLFMCGRKSHRVTTLDERGKPVTLFTIPTEAPFNAHPGVRRSALVGVASAGSARSAGRAGGHDGVPVLEAVLCVELEAEVRDRDTLRTELLELAALDPSTRPVATVLFHPGFPVDVRHNAKIFREKLATWAAKRLRRG